MKKLWKIGILFTSILVIALAFPITVSAAPLEDDRTVFGSSYTLESGRILDGDLNVFGGVVNVEEDAAVTGDMFVLGGLVNINGTIEGNLTVLGGTVTLGSDAVIEGDLFAPGSYLDQEEGAEVRGDLVESWDVPWSEEFDFPFFFQPDIIRSPQTRLFSIVTSIGRGIALTLVLVALGALLLLAMPKPVETMTDALMKAPWHILGYGALTALVMVVGGVLLSLTICLIPVVILAGLTFALAILAGWLTLGYILGKKLAQSVFKATWHPVLSAAIGNLILYLLSVGLNLIPCLGSFIVFVAGLFGLGMVVVTLFGTRTYPRDGSQGIEEPILLNEADDNTSQDAEGEQPPED